MNSETNAYDVVLLLHNFIFRLFEKQYCIFLKDRSCQETQADQREPMLACQIYSWQLHFWNQMLIKTLRSLNKRDTWTSYYEQACYGKHVQRSALLGQSHKVQPWGQEDICSSSHTQHTLKQSCMQIIRQVCTCMHSGRVRPLTV